MLNHIFLVIKTKFIFEVWPIKHISSTVCIIMHCSTSLVDGWVHRPMQRPKDYPTFWDIFYGLFIVITSKLSWFWNYEFRVFNSGARNWLSLYAFLLNGLSYYFYPSAPLIRGCAIYWKNHNLPIIHGHIKCALICLVCLDPVVDVPNIVLLADPLLSKLLLFDQSVV